jgi:ABC-2 type transport system ATP-binding protein
MDEPTVGIDPQSRNNIYEAIQQMKNSGITILYTTHYIEEAERFSDKVGIIDNGKIIAEGSVADLKKQANTNEEIVIHVSNFNAYQNDSLADKFKSAFKFHDNMIKIEVADVKKDLIATLNFCSSLEMEIEQVEIQKVNLEKVFLSLTGKTLRD